MKNTPIFAIDFEGSKRLGIVEYGIVEIRNCDIVSVSTAICAPNERISSRDMKFFDITDERARSEEKFSTHANFFAECRHIGLFCAHNAITEDTLLRNTLPSPGSVKNFAREGELCASWSPWLDTCVLYRNLYPKIASAKLSTLIEIFDLKDKLDTLADKFCPTSRRKWHCAAYDAIACALLLTRLNDVKGLTNVPIRWLAKYAGNPNIDQEDLWK